MRELADKARIEAFTSALAKAATAETDVFLVGGTSAGASGVCHWMWVYEYPTSAGSATRGPVRKGVPPAECVTAVGLGGSSYRRQAILPGGQSQPVEPRDRSRQRKQRGARVLRACMEQVRRPMPLGIHTQAELLHGGVAGVDHGLTTRKPWASFGEFP